MNCLPTCSQSTKLSFSSDGCSMYTKQWLFVNGMKMKLPILRQRRLNAFLRGDHVLYNCGLVGGPRALFEPALAKVNRAYQSYWSLHLPRYLVPGADMLLWNDVALDMSRASSWNKAILMVLPRYRWSGALSATMGGRPAIRIVCVLASCIWTSTRRRAAIHDVMCWQMKVLMCAIPANARSDGPALRSAGITLHTNSLAGGRD